MRPILKFFLCENGFEEFKGNIFVRIAFHVEIDEGAKLSRTAQERPQLRREMGDCIRRVVRTYLRIKRRNFDRKIYDRKKL